MSKLVDKERLAKLAIALDARMKAAVATEKERAEAAEQAIDAKADANAAAIAAINDTEKGLLVQAAAEAARQVAVEKERAEGVEGDLNTRLAAMESTLDGAVDDFFKDAEDGTTVKQMVADIAENAKQIGVNAQAIVDEKERAEEQEGKIRQELANEKAALQKEIDDDIVAERALRVAEEQRIEKAAQDAMAQEVIDRNAAIEVEKLRAEGQEAAIRGEMEVEAARVDKKIADDIKTESDLRVVEEQRIEGLVTAEATKAREEEGKLQSAINVLNGGEDVDGSVAKAVKVEKDRAMGVEQDHEGRIAANEAFVAGYAAKEAKVREDFAAADATNLQAAKDYADQQITALVDSAPEAMNTLNELAEAIKGNEDIYKAYVEEHAQAMAQQKADLQKEIDDDVKAVVDAQKLVNDAQAETNAGFEGRIAKNEAFVAAQPAIDQEQNRRIGVLEGLISGGEGDENALTQLQNAIDAAQEAAEDADAKAVAAQADVDAIEGRLDNEGGLVDRLEAAEAFVAAQPGVDEAQQEAIDDLVGRMEAMEAFEETHSHEAMEQGIADNKAAIEKEVKDRDDAIAKALEVYSTTEEMKGVIGNVVNSLALTMENDKVVLKLGGVDGIALTSVDLDMATDADIDEIIAGLN